MCLGTLVGSGVHARRLDAGGDDPQSGVGEYDVEGGRELHEFNLGSWCYTQFAGLGATLEKMRIDRHLEEAVAGGGDALRVTAVFGVCEYTAIRYSEAAPALLAGPLEVPPTDQDNSFGDGAGADHQG